MVVLVFFEYMAWHYSAGIREYAAVWQNIHWFLWRVFSVSLLLRTFFTPFRRTSEGYGRGFDPSAIAQVFLVNMVTRLVGVMVRSMLLVCALLFQVGAGVLGLILFLWFFFTPVVIPASIFAGVLIMFL